MLPKNNTAPGVQDRGRQEARQGLTGACSSSASYHKPAQNATYVNCFTEIRERVPAIDAARHYGVELSRDGKKAICPFHTDKHPSLSFYRGGFKCFACGASGSSLDLTMQLFGLDLKGAAARLNSDFHLCLPLDHRVSQEERDTYRRVTNAKELFTEWRDKTLNELDAAIRNANLADAANMTDAEAVAVRNRETFLYWADVLLHAPLDEQMQIFRDRKEVERLCQMTMQDTPTKSKTA